MGIGAFWVIVFLGRLPWRMSDALLHGVVAELMEKKVSF